MINAKDLRIGNYISDVHASEKGFWQVRRLLENLCYYGEFRYTYDKLKPIPLSKDWLFKFGWKEIEENLFDNGSYNVAFEKQNDYFQRYKSYKKIKYVHELQNYMYFAHDVELSL